MKTLLLLLLTCAAAPAQLAIYNFTGVITTTGLGVEISPRHAGVLIIDLASQEAVRISKYRIGDQKRIASGVEHNFRIWQARGGPTATRCMIFSGYTTNSPAAYRHELQSYVGKGGLIPIGARTFSLPRSFKGMFSYIQDEAQAPASLMASGTLTHSFSSRATEEARGAGESLFDAASRHLALYRAQGYGDN
jgi:hypothetical protein